MRYISFLPEFTLLLSSGLLLNPYITWPQVVALLLVYSLFIAVKVVSAWGESKEAKELARIKKIEEEIRMLVQAQSFGNLNR